MNNNKLKDDIENISRGNPSKSKIGSRSIGHRLTTQERERFELAKQKGFMELYQYDRKNLENIFHLYCQKLNKPLIVVKHDSNQSIVELNATKERMQELLNLLKELGLDKQLMHSSPQKLSFSTTRNASKKIASQLATVLQAS